MLKQLRLRSVRDLGESNGFTAIYQRDVWTNTTVLVSHNLADDGTIGGQSYNMSMSADGRFISFTSEAPDITANDTNGKPDVFRWDRTTGLVTLVSVNSAGSGPGNSNSGDESGFRPAVTPDGRYIAFASRATDLVAGDTNNTSDVFLRDMQAGTTTLISLNSAGTGPGSGASNNPTISDDGGRISFLSFSNNLTATPPGISGPQAYVRDVLAGVTHLASINAAGSAGGDRPVVISPQAIDFPTISRDGRYVVFRSQATDLISGFVDNNGQNEPDVYLRDMQNDTTRLLTYNQSGTGGSAGSNRGFRFLFAGTGTEVLFDTHATDVFPGDRNAGSDIFAFPIVGSGQIQGTVFADADKDGTLDGGETGIAGVAVYLDRNGNGRPDLGETRLITDADGKFAFTNMPGGTYKIGVLLPNGFDATSPQSIAVTLPTDSSVVADQNFGASAAVADLAVINISAPTDVAAGRPFTVHWTTANFANQPIAGNWQEAVYVSTDNVLDGADRLLGTLSHTGGLGASSSVGRSLSVAAPHTLAGEYFVFVQTDRRMQVTADTNRTNNIGFAFDPLTIAIADLTFAAPVNDAFSGVNQDRYFRLVVEPGKSVRLTLDSDAVAGSTELYASFGSLPTPFHFDHTARTFGQPDQTLTIPLTRPGTYFVLAHSRSGDAATAPFTLTAEEAPFEIGSVSPNSGPASGRVTAEIRGTGFSFNTVPTLEQGGTVINASLVDFRDASLLYTTFDLTGQPTGAYDVHLVDGAQSDVLAGAFTVQPPAPAANPLQLFLLNPEFARTGRIGKVAVEYVNTGDTDITAPLLRLTATNATLRLPGQPTFGGDDLTFLGITADGPAGVLRPGQRGRVDLEFLSNGSPGQPITFQTFFVDPNEVMDWTAIKDTFRPGNIPVDAWDAVFANFLAEAGTTVGDYEALLARSANHLSNLGVRTSDTTRLLNLALAAADGLFTATTLATVNDSVLPSAGFDLLFRREHGQAIHGRYQIGPFGRGWTHGWDAEAITFPGGEVVVRFGSVRRPFVPLPDGSFVSIGGDAATLTVAGGVFTLTELDGSFSEFRADGKFDSFTDLNGNRVTAGYDGSSRLTSLTHSSGATITLTYNAAGFIDTLTDSGGRSVTYSYTGDRLTGYTDQFGAHTYTYVTGQGIAREHALESVNFADDTHLTYAYDDLGRLISEERDGGQVRLTYTYLPSGGGYTITDAAGGTQTLFFDDRGLLAREIDPLGRTTDYRYDDNQNLTQIERPGGTQSDFTYDAQGNLVSAADAVGNTTAYTYDARGRLASFTDARGQTTSYGYDAANNLVSIDYPNGVREQFAYDALGRSLSSTNRRGAVIAYDTNASDQITSKTHADGTTVTYTYDARGRLETATDAAGTITLAYTPLDSLDRITYADGKFLDFDYNIIGQRTSSVDQDGFIVNYAYDDLGRLDTLTDVSGGLVVDYAYDAAGRIARRDNGNGTFTTMDYDVAGQLLTLTHFAPDSSVNSRFEYTYDTLGRRDSVTLTDDDSATDDGTTNYQYDALGQLTSVVLPSGRTIVYEYDAVGNRVSVTDDGVVTLYQTNDLNEYTRAGDVTYTYDADGNRVSKTDAAGTTTYEYDIENRLIAVTGGGDTTTYVHNALGQRSSVTVNGVRTDFLLDQIELGSVASEYDAAGDVIARYTFGLGLASRVAEDGSSAFYDFDANANTVGLTDAAGGYVNRYSYLPFGETTTHAAAVENPFTFVGRERVRVEADDLLDMRFRFYDPLTGQFASGDPLGIAAGDVNFHRYANNDPLQFIDRVGLQASSGNNNDTEDSEITGVCPVEPKPNPNPPHQPPDWFKGLWDLSKFIKWILYGDPGNSSNGSGGGNGPTSPSFPPGGPGASCPTSPSFPPGGNPGGPPRGGPGGSTNTVGSIDPNDINGLPGVGPARFILGVETLPYIIRFENIATAAAPAQEVFVTHTLDADLDLSTFELDDFGFGDLVIDVPSGVQDFATNVDYQNLDGSPLRVDVTAALDADARTVTWTFRSIDPATGLLPEGVFDGFLPPNDANGIGEGFVRYIVRAETGLATGTTLDQQASIVFDVNAPIETNVFTNTIDADAPASNVVALSDETFTASFPVNWVGDDAGGSGIGTYDVFVSIDSGPFEIWQLATTETSATFDGQFGHTYAFYSVAVDNVAHREAAPATADATTAVVDLPLIATDDAFETDEDTLLDIGPSGVLENDRLGNTTETLSVVPFTGTSQLGAAVSVDADGGFRYDPRILALQDKGRGEATTDTFTYELQDTRGRRETATVTITVQGVNDWHNPRMALDVDKSDSVEPLDALIIVNSVNQSGTRLLPGIVGEPEFFYDTNDDGFVSPIDVLLIVNHLNDRFGSPEGEENAIGGAVALPLVAGQSLITNPGRAASRSSHESPSPSSTPVWVSQPHVASVASDRVRQAVRPRDWAFGDEEALLEVLDTLAGLTDSGLGKIHVDRAARSSRRA